MYFGNDLPMSKEVLNELTEPVGDPIRPPEEPTASYPKETSDAEGSRPLTPSQTAMRAAAEMHQIVTRYVYFEGSDPDKES
jgi:hypothetical protein